MQKELETIREKLPLVEQWVQQFDPVKVEMRTSRAIYLPGKQRREAWTIEE